MNKNILIGIVAIVLIGVIGFFALNKNKPAPTVNNQPVVSGPVKEVSVSAKEYVYTPSTITVKKGENIKINFTNNGTTVHNFTITELGVATKTIGPGETDSVTFAVPNTGTFTYFCSVDGHRDLGLQGKLIVQ